MTSIEAAVATDAEAMLDRLEELVAIETPSGDARSIQAFVETMEDVWSDVGAVSQCQAADAGPHLVTEVPGRGRLASAEPLLLVTHSDTVWPRGTLEGAVPWRREAQIVRGPGVYDMKAGLVVIEGAVRALVRTGSDRRPVRVVMVADEEVGSATARGVLTEAALGCRGALGFEPPHPDGALKLGRYGSTRLRLRATGRAAHAALDPDAGVSAIDELVDQLGRIRSHVEQTIAQAPGSVLLNVGTLGGGGRTNVVPEDAWADIGLRFAEAATEESTMAALGALQPSRDGATVRIELLSSRPTWQPAAADQALYDELAARAETLPPARVARGSADSNILGSAGLPSLDGFGPMGAGAHAPDEHIQVVSLRERTALLASLLAC